MYISELSRQSRARYEEKISCGLTGDPYAVKDGWEDNPVVIPKLSWSDLTIFAANSQNLKKEGKKYKLLIIESCIQL